MKSVFDGIVKLWYYVFGNLMCLLLYDRKYINGQYFTGGKWFGITAPGWKWAAHDGFRNIFLGENRGVPWPASGKVCITHPENIEFSPDDLHIFHTYGTYFQAIGAKIKIGRGTWIAPNVGLITANHDKDDLGKHEQGRSIIIGENCWIGMNAVILPGVILGDNTIVGAGAVVTKSFPEGNCVLIGVPAVSK